MIARRTRKGRQLRDHRMHWNDEQWRKRTKRKPSRGWIAPRWFGTARNRVTEESCSSACSQGWLVCSHHSLIYLLRDAHFAHVLNHLLVRSFAHSCAHKELNELMFHFQTLLTHSAPLMPGPRVKIINVAWNPVCELYCSSRTNSGNAETNKMER